MYPVRGATRRGTPRSCVGWPRASPGTKLPARDPFWPEPHGKGEIDVRKCAPRGPAFLILIGLAGCGDSTVGLDPAAELDPEVEAFVVIMNQHRATAGCGALTWNHDVAEVAQSHSMDMVQRSFFAHDNPDGESPFDRLAQAGISYSRAAENIAAEYASAEAVLQGWLDSAGHRANIENCQLTEHGVGLVEARWTHVFITP